MNIKMFQMGFGESILLYEGDSCLLVDCGSESPCQNDYFDNVVRELKEYKNRSLLISHFHMDHMNGIKMLYQNNQGCFNTVYLPNIFQAGNVALEFLILQHLADLKSKKSEPYQIWQLLHDLIKAQNCVQLIQRGTEFSGPSCQFKALWPIEDNPKITAQWNIAQATAVAAGFPLGEVSFIADKLRNAVKFLTSDTNAPASCKEAREETDASLERFRNLHMRYTELLNAKDRESRIIKKKLEELFDGLKENEHSIVFQTADDGSLQILMTGDTTTDSMRKIESNLVKPPVPIKDHYDIYKAPHHGTKNHYYATKFSYDRLLISNGETPKPKRGAISEQYLLNNNVKHIYCTNAIRRRCEYMEQHNCSADACVSCRADGLQIDSSIVVSAPNNIPEIVWNPSNEEDFKRELLKSKQAKITWEYSGTKPDTTIWNADNVTSSTNLRKNIQSRSRWRKKELNGLIRVYIEIV